MTASPANLTRYQPTWESLGAYAVPDWFKDAKFGIFVHWGVYSVPAFGSEWYPRNMYRRDRPEYQHHLDNWGRHKDFGYKDFVPMFTAEKWDPEEWVSLFERAGARYVVPVAEHHDGFPMYATERTQWNAANMGPRRDVVAELGQVVRRRGLKFGVSTHRAFNWRYYAHEDAFDTMDEENTGLYGQVHAEGDPASQEFLEDWYERTKELVDRFRPDVLWFDFGWHEPEFAPYRPRVVAHYYNRGLEWDREVVLQYKDKIPANVAVWDIERGKLDDLRPEYWQTDTAVSTRSWCYLEKDEFKPVATLVHDLVDIVSKNGNLLLNVGPRPDGIIPEEAATCLLGVGEWLGVNGEAIYGTRPWHTYGEGETAVETGHMSERQNAAFAAGDVRFTTKGDTLYAICLGWPTGQIRIKSLGAESIVRGETIREIKMLGSPETLSWSQTEDWLQIETPLKQPCQHAYVFKIIHTADR